MPDLLVQKIARIADRASRLRRTCALLAVLGWTVAAALLLGMGDYLFGVQDSGVRVILSVTLLTVFLWSLFRYLLPYLRYRPTPVETALRIERALPGMGNLLSSAVDFLATAENAPGAGSAALRRRVVAQAEAMLETRDLAPALDRRPAVRAVLLASLPLAALLIVAIAVPSFAGRGAMRLAMPWSRIDWPRVHDLQFVDPPTWAAENGQVEFHLVDRNGRLPREVTFLVWPEGLSASDVRSIPVAADAATVTYRLGPIEGPLRYRAVGGDHTTMPWHRLEVAPAPRIETIRVGVQPPDYTRRPPQKVEPDFTALLGSRVAVRARTTLPVEQAWLVRENPEVPPPVETDAVATLPPGPPAAPSATEPIPLTVSADKREVSLAADAPKNWTLDASCDYHLLLVDSHGIRSGEESAWRAEARRDLPAELLVVEPETPYYTSTRAVIPLEIEATDDLGVVAVELLFTAGDRPDQPPGRIDLTDRITTNGDTTPDEKSLAARQVRQTIRFDWSVAAVPLPAEENTILYRIVVRDGRGNATESPPRRLILLSDEQLQQRLARRENRLLTELVDLLRGEHGAAEKIDALAVSLQGDATPSQATLDQLQAIELQRREVPRRLAEADDSVLRQIERLRRDVTVARLDSPALLRQLDQLDGQLRPLPAGPLSAIRREVVAALKIAQTVSDGADPQAVLPAEARGEMLEALLRARTELQNVIAALDGLVGGMERWERFREFSQQVIELRDRQKQLIVQAEQLEPKLLTQTVESLDPGQRSELNDLVARQREIARRWEQIAVEIDRTAEQLRAEKPQAAAALSDAAQLARGAGLASMLHETARLLEQNRIGNATDRADRCVEAFEQILDALANRREHELDRLLGQLQEASRELADRWTEHRRDAGDLQRLTGDANMPPHQRDRERQRLQKRFDETAQNLEVLRRRLERLRVDRAAEALKEAAVQAGEAAGKCGGTDDAGAAEAAQKAEQAIKQAAEALVEQINQTQRDLLDQQITQLRQFLEALLPRAKSLIDETARLDGLRAEQGQLTAGQLDSLTQLALHQRQIAEEVEQLIEAVSGSEVFAWVLKDAGRAMREAAEKLEKQETGPPVQSLQQAAVQMLVQLFDSLKENGGEAGGTPPAGDAAGGEDQAGAMQMRAASELKLLVVLQEQINQQTDQLLQAKQQNGGRLDPDQQRRLEELSNRQADVARLLLGLMP